MFKEEDGSICISIEDIYSVEILCMEEEPYTIIYTRNGKNDFYSKFDDNGKKYGTIYCPICGSPYSDYGICQCNGINSVEYGSIVYEEDIIDIVQDIYNNDDPDEISKYKIKINGELLP